MFKTFVSGDPYGRPSSSLSPYKPLPSIGAITPRDRGPSQLASNYQSPMEGFNNGGDNVTHRTQKLSLSEQDTFQFYPTDEDADIFTAEDIQGTGHENLSPYTGRGVPNVDQLTIIPQHLSDEIFQTSVANYDRDVHENNVAVNENDNLTDRSHTSDKVSGKGGISNVNSPSSVPKPLDFLHEIPDEPTESEIRFLLAIRLPDGRRIQRHFRPSDPLQLVMHFAENSNLASYEDYILICNAPRTAFSDLSVRLCDTQIKDRTVLYLEEKE